MDFHWGGSCMMQVSDREISLEERLNDIEERLKLIESGIESLAIGMHYLFEFFNDVGIFTNQDPN
jgi:hypothetical protein